MTFPVLGGNGAVATYQIDNSLRFNDDDSARLSRTPSSAGNRKTWTWSCWVKRGNIGSTVSHNLLGSGTSGTASTFDTIRINADKIQFFTQDALATLLNTNAVYRDVSAWYHIIVAVDTTQATSTNRVKIYVNGVEQTITGTYPTLNENTSINNNISQGIGARQVTGALTNYLDGYLTEINFIDGQQLTPTDFGEFDEDSGIWKPKAYEGTYTGNSFYLDFENSGSLGADQSGNSNDFTPTNLASTDQTTDTPTNNFTTFNPLRHNITTGGSESEGNLKYVNSGSVQEDRIFGNIGLSSGKWYWEGLCTGTSPNCQIGLNSTSQLPTNDTYRVTYKSSDGATVGLGGSTYSTYTNGDIIGVAFDADNSQITLYKNNTAQTGSPVSISVDSQGMQPFFLTFSGEGASNSGWVANFGQEGSFAGNKTAQGNSDGNGYGDFYYSPPSGYLALCTQNLATALSPTIDDGSQYFNTVLYTGDGSNPRSLTGVGFQPDFTWIKNRTDAWGHGLADSTRGGGKTLITNSTAVEQTNYTWGYVNSFDSDGFTVDAGASGDDFVNQTSDNYVSWNWKVNGGTTSSNTDGSITSTVQANTTAGFSIVTYTGTGSNGTVGHGLGKAPVYIITKSRSNGSGVWWQYHQGLSGTDKVIHFSTGAEQSASTVFQGTAPTSSVFSVGTNFNINESGGSQLAYCFAEIEGYSKYGSYTGNGSDDGTFIYTGFRPAFVMMKKTSGTGNWNIFDSTRDIDNVGHHLLFANLSNAEETTTSNRDIDFLSNGFKQREGANQDTNGSGGTYIYMAFAESPFVSSTAIPVTAR